MFPEDLEVLIILKGGGRGLNMIRTTTDSYPHQFIDPLPISPHVPFAKLFHKSYGYWTTCDREGQVTCGPVIEKAKIELI